MPHQARYSGSARRYATVLGTSGTVAGGHGSPPVVLPCGLGGLLNFGVLKPCSCSLHRCRHRCKYSVILRYASFVAPRTSDEGGNCPQTKEAAVVAVTIYDVAKQAGVSPRTVSHVVNDYPS